MIPSEYHAKPGQIALNIGRATCRVTVENHGDQPIQIGSHYHSAKVSPMLEFDRQQIIDYRLNTPTGTAVRFKPDQKREVKLMALVDYHAVFGFCGEVIGPLKANDG